MHKGSERLRLFAEGLERQYAGDLYCMKTGGRYFL